MFDEIKRSIAAFEGRVNGAFSKVETSVRTLRVEISKLDQELTHPFDELKALIGKTRGAVMQELDKTRREVEDLAPPR